MGLLQKCEKRGAKETTGRFNSRKTLERFVIEAGQCNVKIKLIVEQSGASRKAVDRILNMHKVDYSNKNTAAINGAKKMADLMDGVNRATIEHLREVIAELEVKVASKDAVISRMVTRLEGEDAFKSCIKGPDTNHKEWPATTKRIEAIMQNGNDGDHYAKLNDSHTIGENQHAESNK